jgi:flavin reductase (DIM6/NTAB) family NADH-FMN oxidoreductase RutF
MPDALPDWPPGTVAVLSTGGGAPHAIPVSTAVRLGPRTIALALAERRESLARLRDEPRCAVTIVAEGIAITAHGRATVEPLEEALAAVRITVEQIQDHADPRFAIDEGVRWRWTDTDAADRDAAVRAALRALAP